MQQIPFICLFKTALRVSSDKLAHFQEHFFDHIHSFWYNASILLLTGDKVVTGRQQCRYINNTKGTYCCVSMATMVTRKSSSVTLHTQVVDSSGVVHYTTINLITKINKLN